MARVKDQWTQIAKEADGRPLLDKDGRPQREPNKRWPRDKHGKPMSRPKGKRWLACWIGPDGKEHTAAFELKDAAQKHAQAMETDQLRGVYFDSRKGEMKLTEYARDKWLPAQLHLRPNSVETYTYHLEKHIIPAFGTWRLAMIGREDVQKFVIALTKKPATAKADGRKLAATTVHTDPAPRQIRAGHRAAAGRGGDRASEGDHSPVPAAGAARGDGRAA
jgi:hypothetical protein